MSAADYTVTANKAGDTYYITYTTALDYSMRLTLSHTPVHQTARQAQRTARLANADDQLTNVTMTQSPEVGGASPPS